MFCTKVISNINLNNNLASANSNEMCQQNQIEVLYANQDDYELANTISLNEGISFSYYDIKEERPSKKSVDESSGIIFISKYSFSDSPWNISSYIDSVLELGKPVMILTPYLSNFPVFSRINWGLLHNSSDNIMNGSITILTTEYCKNMTGLDPDRFLNFNGSSNYHNISLSENLTYIKTYSIESGNATLFPDIPIVFNAPNYPQTLLIMNFAIEDPYHWFIGSITKNFLNLETLPSGETTTNNPPPIIPNIDSFELLRPILVKGIPFFLILSLLFLVIWQKERFLQFLRRLWKKSIHLIVLVGYISTRSITTRRVDSKEVHKNLTRKKIIDYLHEKENSGAYFYEIKVNLQIGTGQLLWHLEVLQDFGIINVQNIEKTKIYYLKEFPINLNQKRLEMALKSMIAKRIITSLLNQKLMTISELANNANCHRTTVVIHLKKLESLGLINVEKEGRKRIFQLNNINYIRQVIHNLN